MTQSTSDSVAGFVTRRNLSPDRRGTVRAIFMALTCAAIVCGAACVTAYWMMNRPRAGRRRPPVSTPVVQVREVQKSTHRITVHAMGIVLPVEEVNVVARVDGQLVEVNPDLIPGGHLKKGEVLAKTDPRDYTLAVAEAQAALRQAELTCRERELAIEQHASTVAQAETNLTLERARRDVAQGEYDLLINVGEERDVTVALANPNPGNPGTTAGTVDPAYRSLGADISKNERELILREPYLRSAEAALTAAAAGREQAKVAHQTALAAAERARTGLAKAALNLEWTNILAPFDAVVRSKRVGAGSYVSPGNPVATLVNTGAYWIAVSVPVNRLRWIDAPTNGGGGSPARVYHTAAWGEEGWREGAVKRIDTAIETQGRMATVIVEVKDPLCLNEENRGRPALLLDSYVDVTIEGRSVEGAVEVPRSVLREGDQVWVLSADRTLDIRPVQIAARSREHVYVTQGLESGDQLIANGIPSPVQGMALRRMDELGEEDPDMTTARAPERLSADETRQGGE